MAHEEEPTLVDAVRMFEREREARRNVYAHFCFDAMLKLASISLNTDDDGRAAFLLYPDYGVVTATVNDLIAHGYQGPGEPPKM